MERLDRIAEEAAPDEVSLAEGIPRPESKRRRTRIGWELNGDWIKVGRVGRSS